MGLTGQAVSELPAKQLGGVVYPYDMPGYFHRNLVESYPADAWVVETWEQYKCREPSLALRVVGELQAKLALLRCGNEKLPKDLRVTQLPKETFVVERDGVRYRTAGDEISFAYLDGDTYYGGVKIYRVADFVPFAKRQT